MNYLRSNDQNTSDIKKVNNRLSKKKEENKLKTRQRH